jgi:hypothetical protein
LFSSLNEISSGFRTGVLGTISIHVTKFYDGDKDGAEMSVILTTWYGW